MGHARRLGRPDDQEGRQILALRHALRQGAVQRTRHRRRRLRQARRPVQGRHRKAARVGQHDARPGRLGRHGPDRLHRRRRHAVARVGAHHALRREAQAEHDRARRRDQNDAPAELHRGPVALQAQRRLLHDLRLPHPERLQRNGVLRHRDQHGRPVDAARNHVPRHEELQLHPSRRRRIQGQLVFLLPQRRAHARKRRKRRFPAPQRLPRLHVFQPRRHDPDGRADRQGHRSPAEDRRTDRRGRPEGRDQKARTVPRHLCPFRQQLFPARPPHHPRDEHDERLSQEKSTFFKKSRRHRPGCVHHGKSVPRLHRALRVL